MNGIVEIAKIHEQVVLLRVTRPLQICKFKNSARIFSFGAGVRVNIHVMGVGGEFGSRGFRFYTLNQQQDHSVKFQNYEGNT